MKVTVSKMTTTTATTTTSEKSQLKHREAEQPLLGHAYPNNNNRSIHRMTTHSLECIACQRRYILFAVRCLGLVVNWFHLQRARPLHKRNKWMQYVWPTNKRCLTYSNILCIFFPLLFFFLALNYWTRNWFHHIQRAMVSAGGIVARMYVSLTSNAFFVRCNAFFRSGKYQLNSRTANPKFEALENASRGKCKCNLSYFHFRY